MSYLDEEIIEDFKKNNARLIILPEPEHECIVNKINETFPFSGNQIAWNSLSDSTYFGITASKVAIESLSKEIRLICEDSIFVVGDATDNAYSIDIDNLPLTLQVFSTIPQHTYIVSRATSWIACLSFEGHLYFANLPPIPKPSK